jgi:hypothetical protein
MSIRELSLAACAAADVVMALLETDAKTATRYLGPKQTVRGTYVGKRDRRTRRHTIVISVGSPNYAERAFIRECKTVGVGFPIREVLLKYPPLPRK